MRSGRAAAFFEAAHRSIADADGRFTLVGPVTEVGRLLATLTEGTHRRVWSMAERTSLGHLRRRHDGTRAAVARGVDCRWVLSPGATRVRLLSSFLRPEVEPVRIVPVPGAMLVADDLLLLAGRRGTHRHGEVWRSDDPEVVDAAASAYLDLWDRGRPLEEVATVPPLDERSLAVALGMIDGDTDREIADRLGVAPRTVQATVRRVVDWCGARNRTHAVALMSGSDE